MKTQALVIAIVIVSAGYLTYRQNEQNQLDALQLASYEAQVTRLLGEIEQGSRSRLELESTLKELRSEINMLDSQLTSVTNQLAISEERINPEYDRMESEIRQQIAREEAVTEQRRRDTYSPGNRVELVRQLSELGPLELGEVMSLQGQFGGFLQSLAVSDERMEIVVDALGNLIADQNNARIALMQDARLGGNFDRREMGTQMREIMSPEAQRASLSFVLTDDELSALDTFQSQQGNQGATIRSFVGNPNADGAAGAFIFGGGRGGSGTASGVIIERAPPPDQN